VGRYRRLAHGSWPDVTRVTLQGYLRRVRVQDTKAGSGAAGPRPTRARERLASRPASAAAAVLEEATTPHPTAEAAPRMREIIERRAEPGARRSEFVVRPESKDI
jgi:hypothetical protein